LQRSSSRPPLAYGLLHEAGSGRLWRFHLQALCKLPQEVADWLKP